MIAQSIVSLKCNQRTQPCNVLYLAACHSLRMRLLVQNAKTVNLVIVPHENWIPVTLPFLKQMEIMISMSVPCLQTALMVRRN